MPYLYNANLEPSRRLQFRQIVTAERDHERQLVETRRMVLERICNACFDMEGVVKTRKEKNTIEVFADCFIFTTDEIYELVKDKFSEGVLYGRAMANMNETAIDGNATSQRIATVITAKQFFSEAIADERLARQSISLSDYRRRLEEYVRGASIL